MAERMTDVEAMMWNLEKDPHLSSAFANVTVLDRPIDLDRFRRRMARAVSRLPRLAERPVAALGRMAPPEWHADADFDLDYHIRRIGLPSPGGDRQLLDLAAFLVQAPFDRTRPLWEFTVIDGLDGGRGAMVQKFHHTVTDGEGGVRLSVEFLDQERHPDRADEPDGAAAGASPPTPGRSLLETAIATGAHNLRRGAGIGRRLTLAAGGVALHPNRVAGLGSGAIDTARALTRQLSVTEGHGGSSLWSERTLRRQVEVLRVPFDPAHRAAKALGGSINDLFVTGAAGAAGDYHRALGQPLDELRMAMPVSTRTERGTGGNAFTPSRLVVSTDPDPVARFRSVHERLTTVKRDSTLGLTSAVAGVANLLPTSVLVRVARRQTESVDLTTSNVRGAPFELYIAGAKILANYPIGPLAGTPCNLTTLSYNGSLDMGLHIDRGAVAEPARLRDCLESSFEELLGLG